MSLCECGEAMVTRSWNVLEEDCVLGFGTEVLHVGVENATEIFGGRFESDQVRRLIFDVRNS
jgi:hypothetical protein